MKKVLTPLLILILSIYCDVEAQYAFDVKTNVVEKHDLQIAKLGVIQAIKGSSWATEVEMGENYSLWLTNMQRVHNGDSLYVILGVELRTPAMLSMGKYVAGGRVWVRYHWTKMREFSRDSVDIAQFTKSQFDGEKAATAIAKMAAFASTFSGASIMGGNMMLGDFTGALAGEFFGQLGNVLKKRPSAVEVMESRLLGQQVLAAVEEMIKSQ